jgi:hypothetical protein
VQLAIARIKLWAGKRVRTMDEGRYAVNTPKRLGIVRALP